MGNNGFIITHYGLDQLGDAEIEAGEVTGAGIPTKQFDPEVAKRRLSTQVLRNGHKFRASNSAISRL